MSHEKHSRRSYFSVKLWADRQQYIKKWTLLQAFSQGLDLNAKQVFVEHILMAAPSNKVFLLLNCEAVLKQHKGYLH